MENRARIFKGENMVEIKEVLKEIKNYAKEIKNKNGHGGIPSNKDMNLWMIKWMLEQDRRITKVETKQSLLFWLIGIGLTACGIIMKFG